MMMVFALAASRIISVLERLALLFLFASQPAERTQDVCPLALGVVSLQSCLANGGARLAFPGSIEYSHARVGWNDRQLYKPAAFVFPTIVAQVQHALACSLQAGIGIVPRGGGHSFEDYSLGGQDGVLVIDMVGFQQLSYNEATKTAIVGAGWRLGPLYLALWNAGKVTIPAGNCPSVGVAGHALGGGWGFSARKFGMVSDNILEAHVVIADGTVVTTNASHNQDLYFALRGAGAVSYGIVTQFTFRMHDVSAPVTHFKYTWTNNSAVQVQNFKAFQAWGLNLLAEISATFYLNPFGKSWLEGTYLGPQSSLAPLVEPFLSSAGANPIISVEQLTWIQVILVNAGYSSSTDPNTLSNPPLPSFTSKGKSLFVKAPGLSDAGVDAMITAMVDVPPNTNAYFLYDLYGSQSAINQVAPGVSAFVHRSSLYSIQMVAHWVNSKDAVASMNYIQRYWNVVRPFTTGDAYQNYIDRDVALSTYYGTNLKELVASKKKWDPENVFNFPQGIPTQLEVDDAQIFT